MLALWEKLVEWNKQMKGLPRKLALIACVLITCMIFIAIFPYCWPFVLALAFAVIMEPLVKLLCRLLGKLPAGKLICHNRGGTLAVTVGGDNGVINSILLEGPTEVVKIYEV